MEDAEGFATMTAEELYHKISQQTDLIIAEGTLELRGVRKALKFLATVSTLSDGAIAAEAHFDFDRTQWKIIYGSSRYFEHLGMHLVFDPVTIGLRILAR